VYKKYTIPLSIFVVYENINFVVWTSQGFGPNNYAFYINYRWFYSLNTFFKNEVFLSSSTIIENSAADKKNHKNIFGNFFFKKTHITSFYLYYLFTLKIKLLLLTLPNKHKQLPSIDKIYKSTSWLERETGEMFGIVYYNKTDNRRLLLDYSKQENPLLKDYPTEGFNDVFYNFFEDQVIYNLSTVVEL
jgi:NADH:ubiquinone oxidoreductase subunit C